MRKVLLGMVGLLVSAAALVLAFANVRFSSGFRIEPRVHWGEITAALSEAHLGWLLAYVLFNVASLAVRAVQLRALVRRRDGRPPSLAATWHAVAIGMLAQNLLPARLGEAAKVVALAKADDVAPAQAAGGVVLARVLDLVALVVVTCVPVLLLRPLAAHGSFRTVAAIATGVAALLVAALVALYRFRDRVIALGHRLRPSIGRAIEGFSAGLAALGSARRLTPAALATLAAPTLVALCYAAALHAFDLGGLPRGASLLLVATVFLAVALPAAPSSVGVYHAACTWLLTALGASAAQAAAFAILTHALGAISFILLGAISTIQIGAWRGGWQGGSRPFGPRPRSS